MTTDDFKLEADAQPPKIEHVARTTGTLDLRCCDCMEMMREFSDGHFDLAIVDPVYGIGAVGWHPTTAHLKNRKWDKFPTPPEYFIDLRRVSRVQIIWVETTLCFLHLAAG